MKINVIIPTYKPGVQLKRLLTGLRKQTVEVNRVIILNTDVSYWDASLYDASLDYEVVHIEEDEFDHAGTRARGMSMCEDADYVLMMTQDAIPADAFLVENLLKGFSSCGPKGEPVAVTYARQLPIKGCTENERYVRNLSYPKQSRIKTLQDEKQMGIATYFCSDVCAMYDTSVYRKLKGFCEKAIFNEDMIYAFGAIHKGYAIHYVATAKVVHSHDYTYRQQFCRHFDMGVSQAEHPEVFGRVSSESEGISRVLHTAEYLALKGKWTEVFRMLGNNVARYGGYMLGKNFRHLDVELCRRFSSNKKYWK